MPKTKTLHSYFCPSMPQLKFSYVRSMNPASHQRACFRLRFQLPVSVDSCAFRGRITMTRKDAGVKGLRAFLAQHPLVKRRAPLQSRTLKLPSADVDVTSPSLL